MQEIFEVYETLPPTLQYEYTCTTVSLDLNLSELQILQSRTTPYLQIPAAPPPTTFSAYIERLDQWEYCLLCNTTINTDVFRLLDTIQNNPWIIAASNGSVTSSIGAYGWICSLPHGQRLATNHGPVFSSSPSSFRTEAYGLLSYHRFLYHVSQYTHSPLPMDTILYTDSASLIAKIGEIEKWPYFFPNATMDPDWDVLQQIITSRRLFPLLPVLRLVKGHQDVDCPYVTLPLPDQLNVDADHLASSYAPHPHETPNIVPIIAGTAASLHLSSETITTKYRSALRKAASTDTIQHYIQHKHKWTDTEFASINWVAHRHSVCRFYHKKQFIFKFVNEWLPLG